MQTTLDQILERKRVLPAHDYAEKRSFTHTCLGNKKGTFFLDRQENFKLFSILGAMKYPCSYGITERPTWYSMLRVDIDISAPSQTTKQLYDKKDVYTLVAKLQTWLRNNIENFEERHAVCLWLSKEPYLKDDKCKHGFHLQFPFVYLSLEDMKLFEAQFTELDKMAGKQWMIYKTCKSEVSGFYSPEMVILNATQPKKIIMRPSSWFAKHYSIIDVNERPITLTKQTVESYYPQILSINTLGKPDYSVELKKRNILIERYISSVSEQTEDPAEEAEEDAKEELSSEDEAKLIAFFKGYLAKKDPSQYTEWSSVFWFVKSNYRDIEAIRDMCLQWGVCDGHDLGEQEQHWEKIRAGRPTIDIKKLGIKKSLDIQKTTLELDREKYTEYIAIPKKERTEAQQRLIDRVNADNTQRKIKQLFSMLKWDSPDNVYDPKIDNKGYRGMTYREIAQRDPTFAQWVVSRTKVDNHTKSFQNALRALTEPSSKYTEISEKCYVSEKMHLMQCTVTCIKAGLGFGKSEAVIRHLQTHTYKRVIVLTPRISYARSAHSRFSTSLPEYDWKLYLNSKGKILATHVIIQAESLYRLDISDMTNTCLVVDECEAFLTQLTSTKTHGGNHMRNIKTLLDILDGATKVFMLDAFLSRRTLDFLELALEHNDCTYEVLNFTAKPREQKALQLDTDENFLSSLRLDLQAGKNIFFFCSSLSKIRKVFAPFLDSLGVTYLEYSSTSKKTIKDVSEEWKKAQVVICTSVITVGIDFNIEHFDRSYCWLSSNSRNLVRDVFQSLFRTRQLRDDLLVYHINTKAICIGDIPTSLMACHEKIKQETVLTQEIYTQYDCNYSNAPKWLTSLVAWNMFEYGVSIRHTHELFLKYLDICGYTLIDSETDNGEDEVGTDWDMCCKIPYSETTAITTQEFNQLKRKRITDVLEPLEQANLIRYYFDRCFNIPVGDIEFVWAVYNNGNHQLFHNMRVLKGITEESYDYTGLLDSQTYTVLQSKFLRKVHIIGDVVLLLGLEFPTYTISREMIQRFQQLLKDVDFRQRICSTFSIDTGRFKSMSLRATVGILNDVLKEFGFFNIECGKRKRERINGKIVDVTPYELKEVYPVVPDWYSGNIPVNFDIWRYLKPAVKHGLLTETVDVNDFNL